MLTGVLVPVVVAFAALGVDVAYMQLTRLQAQFAADAASHAAFVRFRVTQSQSSGNAAANYMLSRNPVGGTAASLDTIQYGAWLDGSFTPGTSEVNAVKVNVGRTGSNAVDLFFAAFLGVPTWEVDATSITAGRHRQIVIAQDITGSFRDDIDNARGADRAFLKYLKDHPYPEDMVGMTTFTGGVEATAWSPLQYMDGNFSAIDDWWKKLDWCNCEEGALQATFGNPEDNCYGDLCPVPSWEEYCVEYNEGHNTRPEMQDCWTVGQNTAPGPGIDQAVDELLAEDDPKAFRAIIIVSDGLPCCGSLTATREAEALDAVDRAWANGIHVWSVAFNGGSGDFSFLESLTRGLGTAFETPNSAELDEIMVEIAASIPVATVQ